MESVIGSVVSNVTNNIITNHPYYPLEVEIVSYLANEWSVPTLLALFAATCSGILLTTLFIVNKVHPNLPGAEKAAIWWFVLCQYSRSSNL